MERSGPSAYRTLGRRQAQQGFLGFRSGQKQDNGRSNIHKDRQKAVDPPAGWVRNQPIIFNGEGRELG